MRNIVVIFIVVLVGVAIFFLFYKSSEKQAIEAVETFYTHEQNADFSDSWEMFHPFMKEKFDKAHYLQDRAHVFMNHFGVTTFSFSVEEANEIKDWKPEVDAATIDVVYKVIVEQYYQGKYGNFTLVQNVFATEIDGEWKILWDYTDY
ncbi:hypothetical protein SAMN04488072_11651 [Lentibacillus halodurans]|uniref:DUF4878 domain-containing protein n=1 Tax=Lentibacillus halodurans TaxID=237679 RepID=A0A1I1A6W2_9BACI|nr:hypothetical protein [Lentibacillus halodurans]SFB33096.1 hypothetical protein SAMN04488072_11651 [Lentibacillus halodurans]